MFLKHTLILASLVILPLSAGATTISQDLKNQVSSLREGDKVSFYVVFNEQVNLEPFRERFNREILTNSQRRDILFPALKEVANRTQKNVQAFLEKNKNSFETYEAQFLANRIYVQNADPKILDELLKFKEIDVFERIYENKIPENEKITSKNPPQTNTVASSLTAINADKLWSLGFTGAGRIVMNIDTGVDGSHPYLASNWYGLQPGVTWNNAWNDAVGGGSTFPEDLPVSTHGTGTMSMICGHSTTDTIGTAPGAWWIASKHNNGGSSTGIANSDAGMNWAVNLPSNILDKLDVINNSYGSNNGGCDNSSSYSFYNSIELVGITLVWSAGNEGPGSQTIGQTAAGAISPVNTFSVGSVNQNQETVSDFSSRGPSGCANGIIVPPPHNAAYKVKPEVVAQGASIKVAKGSSQGGGTETTQGTSFSGPIVAGSIAILRQVNPGITPEQAKLALLNTATDFGTPGDDNDYGRGRINILEAASEISPYILTGTITNSVTGNPIPFAKILVNQTSQEFETGVDGTYTIKPLTSNITLNVSAFGYQNATVTNVPVLVPNVPASLSFSLTQNATATISGTLSNANGGATVSGVVEIIGITANGEVLFSTLTTGNGSFSTLLPEETYKINFIPDYPFPRKTTSQFTVVASQNQTFNYSNAPANVLFIGGDDAMTVDSIYQDIVTSDYFHWDLQEIGAEPTIAQLGLLTSPGAVVWYTDGKSGDVLTNTQEQLLVSYLNSGGNLLLTGQNLLESESGGSLTGMLGIAHNGNYAGSSDFVRGNAGGVLSNPSATQGFLMRAAGINANNLQTSKDLISIVANAVQICGYGSSGSEGIAGTKTNGSNWKAILLGFDIASITKTSPTLTSAETVLSNCLKSFGLVLEANEPKNSLPNGFSLAQNFPNPFNPTTTIEFSLPANAKVELTIFNTLGQKVQTLVSKNFEAGTHNAVWNGTDFSGKQVSSGIYFYQLKAENFSETKKMVLLK